MTLTITRPDDWHLHLRDGAVLRAVLPHTVARFARAVVMPNLSPPVTTCDQARAYRQRILAAVPPGAAFTPLMTLYLTDTTSPAEIRAARDGGFVHAVKLYPAGATTNSASGVTDIDRVMPALEEMVAQGLPLLVHGEVTDPEVDIFDREAVFLDRVLDPLHRRLPGLKIVLEHVTTRDGVQFVQASGPGVAGTITAHHLLLNRNALFAGGLRPHAYCLPVLKREKHRQALVAAATGGDPSFFLGTDSAPHPVSAKESACGCAGIYTAATALELYATAFAEADALDKLDGFAGRHGPAFYGLPVNTDTVTLAREEWRVPERFALGEDVVAPMGAGEVLGWRLVG